MSSIQGRSFALLTVLLLVLSGSLWQTGHWLARGAPLQTDISKLVPTGTMDPVSQHLYDSLLDRAGSRLSIVVEGGTAGKVEEASIALHDGLAGISGVDDIDDGPDPSKLARLADILAPYRDLLLSARDRSALVADADSAVDRWMAADPFLRPLPVQDDPLGTLGRFLQTALPAPGRIDSDGFFYWLERDKDESYAIAAFADLKLGGLAMDEGDQFRNDLDRLVQTIERQHDVQIHASGAVFHASAGKRQAKWESSVFGTISAVLILLLLTCTFASPAPALILIWVAGNALLGGFSVAIRLFDHIHVLTLVMALPMIGIAVDYVIHSQVDRGRRGTGSGMSPHLMRALCWGCLSSVLGYAALGGVDVPVLSQVSVVLVSGLAIALLWVIALAYVLPSGKRGGRIARMSESRPIHRVSAGTDIHHVALVAALLVGILASGAAIQSDDIKIVDDPGILYFKNPALAAVDRHVQQRLGMAGNQRTLVVEGRNPDQVLRRQEDLVKGLAKRFEVSSTGISSLVPSAERQRRNHRLSTRAFSLLSDKNREALEVAEPTAATGTDGLLHPSTLPSWIQAELPPFELTGTGDRKPWAAVSINDAVDWSAVSSWCETQPGCRTVDSVAGLTRVLADTHEFARTALYTALVLVTLVFLGRYRRRGIWAGGILLLVLLSGQVIPGWLGVPLTLFTTAGTFILLGLSVDYLVFMSEAAHRRRQTWLAFFLAAATTILTFGILLFSRTPAVRMLAAPVAVGIPVMLVSLYFIQLQLTWPNPETNNAEHPGYV